MKTLKDWLGFNQNDVIEPKILKMFDAKVVKEFTMTDMGTKKSCWASWQEFATHKHVSNWCLLENGYAVGFNESPSRGYAFPHKKLSAEQVEKYMAHDLSYDEYYNVSR